MTETSRLPHEYDDDAVCIHCGFDGAEWWALYGMEEPELRAPKPECSERNPEAAALRRAA